MGADIHLSSLMRPATEKQLQYLRSLRVKHPQNISTDEATTLIERALRRRKYRDITLWGVIIFYLAACAIALLAGVFRH